MEEKEDKLGKKPDTEVAVWGLGLTNNKLDELIKLFNKLLEKVDKMDTKLYWLEKRDKEREEKEKYK